MKEATYVAISTQKGGAGKTTLTVLVASYLHYVKEGVSKQAHPLFISDTVRQFVYAAISRIGDLKNSQFIP